MNIYKLSEKELKAKKKEFNKLPYGKRVTWIYFCLPFVCTLITLELAMQFILCFFLVRNDCYGCLFLSWLAVPLIIFILLTLVSYSRGYKEYYREFKEYIDSSKKQ